MNSSLPVDVLSVNVIHFVLQKKTGKTAAPEVKTVSLVEL